MRKSTIAALCGAAIILSTAAASACGAEETTDAAAAYREFIEHGLPYLVGAGIGVLCWLIALLLDEPLGCSAAFARSSGMIRRLVRGKRAAEGPNREDVKPTIDWQCTLVVGIFIGALLASVTSGEFELSWVPVRWARQFGHNAAGRWLAALVGGVFVGFGARWVARATGGHGVSSGLQLAVSGWVSAACFSIAAVATAMLIYL